VGVPSLADNDRFRGYREDVLRHIRESIGDVHHEVCITPPSSLFGIEGIVDRQNFLIEKTLAGEFDFLWLIQGDVEVPCDAFQKLFSLDVDVAYGFVRRHDSDSLICGFLDEKAKVWYLPKNAVESMILSGWVFAGASCMLIKRRVLEAGIRFRYERGVGEDILFAYDFQKAGFVAKVHGDVLCGHLPEWPLGSISSCMSPSYGLVDVGCGHRPKGDVNVDLFPEPTAHRCVDQRVNDDVALDVRSIPNFVKANACHLPFKDGAFKRSYSWHLIEHLVDPEAFLRELMRVSTEQIEVRCPNGEYLSCRGETKPLHLHDFSLQWFQEKLSLYPDWDFAVRWDYSQSEPWEIVVEGVRKFG
jgi:hypothetical protein